MLFYTYNLTLETNPARPPSPTHKMKLIMETSRFQQAGFLFDFERLYKALILSNMNYESKNLTYKIYKIVNKRNCKCQEHRRIAVNSLAPEFSLKF